MKLAIITLFLFQNVTAQISNSPGKLMESVSNIYKGFTETIEWYDIPVGVFYLSRNYFNKSDFGNYISAPPANFEINFSNTYEKSNNVSLGSMDKNILPHSIFMSRIGFNLIMDIFSDRKISSTPYRNAFLFEKSLVYTYTLTEITKKIVKRYRPDNSDSRSFFSGHTSTTFAAATFLFLELNEVYRNTAMLRNDPLLLKTAQTISFSVLYGWAAYVGYSRIRDNKHYLSDVLVGASVGTLISYLLFQQYNPKENESDNISIYSYNDTLLLSFSMKF